ncbi:MAG: hypothetical protein PHX61_13650 [Alphaproteobacteria bacterium]|nr:hypothetical protein [Alphaproteobacteria bacterium]
MGTGRSGRYLNTRGSGNGHTITDNLHAVTQKHPLSPSGYFGKEGSRTSVRRIESKNPQSTAHDFFNKLSNGGKIENLPNGKEQKATMRDGSIIVYRPISSSDGSPAAEIRCLPKNAGLKEQKIHFTKEK